MSFVGAINIEESVDSPRIVLDAENGIFLIEGPSYPEDAYEIYECVLEWLEKLDYEFKNDQLCEFRFKVLSSASRKMVYEILIGLEKAHTKKQNVQVSWYYEKYDEDMFEMGEDFSEVVNLPFKLVVF